MSAITYEKLLDRWIAVGNSGTILVSDDDGDSWRAPQPPNSTAKQFNFLNIITDNGSSGLLMVVGSYIKPNYPEGLFSAILTTYNAGGDWQTQYNVPGVCVYAVAFNPQDRKRRYLGRYFAHPMMQNRRAKRDDYKPSAALVTGHYVP
ncbi:putative protein related to plant photosystem II stability/assembly factor [Piscirickettsia salmonis]|uniref:hypothetical protein n=1 Tax=Piscirickettsia salmonis TaxID=1238 RepID=UPI0012BAE6CA|nr:hypothetical protein [Piscirickettsia salmonis]QGP52680.1 putative protein related to plant photosystem II stability/assembly factor [Piscirickettsia salmonis]QGP57542.1 putative protein related to plant photosystem II stability/assembly factor [Piscirickettsia salmonis]QGP62248.1 putative protein related to plant photosystem II stability/assembly factor [Piscirickettsia salmonis]